jgi:hypothetical protein
MKIIAATIAEMTMTTIVELTKSLRVGHVTLRISRYTFFMYVITFSNTLFSHSTGLEGFEPPTLRFGAGCSPVRATGLFYFFMNSMFSTKRTVFLQFKPPLHFFIFASRVISVFTSLTRKSDDDSHYSMIFVTTPAPTVLPPSRIANRNPCSIATGVINSTSKFALSPGITISTPFGNFATPVTSVVRT